jgi:hypothetical protein
MSLNELPAGRRARVVGLSEDCQGFARRRRWTWTFAGRAGGARLQCPAGRAHGLPLARGDAGLAAGAGTAVAVREEN